MSARRVELPAVGISEHTPLRLAEAAQLAFPTGSMTVSGLRKEGARGTLEIERIAGKDFTTLAAIEEMRKRCRDRQKARGSGSGKNAVIRERESLESDQSGLSETETPSLVPDSFLLKLQRRKHA